MGSEAPDIALRCFCNSAAAVLTLGEASAAITISAAGLPSTTSGTVEAPWATDASRRGNKIEGIFMLNLMRGP